MTASELWNTLSQRLHFMGGECQSLWYGNETVADRILWGEDRHVAYHFLHPGEKERRGPTNDHHYLTDSIMPLELVEFLFPDYGDVRENDDGRKFIVIR